VKTVSDLDCNIKEEKHVQRFGRVRSQVGIAGQRLVSVYSTEKSLLDSAFTYLSLPHYWPATATFG
jgi:hypothetical protein